ncbi:MAG TPA: anti-sigma factor RsbA family regulatory protein [Pseudonocardiaceae bacterium]
MSTVITDPFAHPAFFYRGHAEYLAGTVPFITDGLAAGEPVAVAVPSPRLDVLRSALGPAARDVLLLDMTVVGRNPGRIIPGVLRAFADEHPDRHVRIIGEPIWPARSAMEYPACAQHEALINDAFTGRRITILCPYDAAHLAEHVLADAARTHPVLVDGNGTRDSRCFAPAEVVTDYNTPLPPPSHARTVAVTVTGLPDLRRTAAAFGLRRGLTAERTQDLVLAVTELATNSIEHAVSTATVLLGGTADDVVCQVRDTGHIADPLAGRRPAAGGQQRGRGLLLVNHLADLVRVHTTATGTTIEAHFTAGR